MLIKSVFLFIPIISVMFISGCGGSSSSGGSTGAGSYRINWSANKEASVNRTGGGYKVQYANNTSFTGNLEKDVPFVSGSLAPTSCDLVFDPATQSGTWYVRVIAYSDIDATSVSTASQRISILVK